MCYVDELLGYMSVCDEPEVDYYCEIDRGIQTLINAKYEIAAYISELMDSELYVASITLPLGNIDMFMVNDEVLNTLDYIRLPFGIFSLNVWNKLLADKDNPVFKVLRYMEFNTRGIVLILASHGVTDNKPITLDMMVEHNIFDVFNLRTFTGIYMDIDKYLDGGAY